MWCDSAEPDRIRMWKSAGFRAKAVVKEKHHSENYKALLLRWPEIFSIQSRWVESMPIITAAAAAAKSLKSCPTLCDPIDGGPPGSPVPGILQARTLEWVAISFSNA